MMLCLFTSYDCVSVCLSAECRVLDNLSFLHSVNRSKVGGMFIAGNRRAGRRRDRPISVASSSCYDPNILIPLSAELLPVVKRQVWGTARHAHAGDVGYLEIRITSELIATPPERVVRPTDQQANRST
jgi:hypothetical protein